MKYANARKHQSVLVIRDGSGHVTVFRLSQFAKQLAASIAGKFLRDGPPAEPPCCVPATIDQATALFAKQRQVTLYFDATATVIAYVFDRCDIF